MNTEQSWEFQSAQKFNSKLMVAVENLVSVRVGLGHQLQLQLSSTSFEFMFKSALLYKGSIGFLPKIKVASSFAACVAEHVE